MAWRKEAPQGVPLEKRLRTVAGVLEQPRDILFVKAFCLNAFDREDMPSGLNSVVACCQSQNPKVLLSVTLSAVEMRPVARNV